MKYAVKLLSEPETKTIKELKRKDVIQCSASGNKQMVINSVTEPYIIWHELNQTKTYKTYFNPQNKYTVIGTEILLGV